MDGGEWGSHTRSSVPEKVYIHDALVLCILDISTHVKGSANELS